MSVKKSLLSAAALLILCGAGQAPEPSLQLNELAKVAKVDARYQGFNIEMVEVTGGRFWARYGGPEGEVYRQRPPIDLNNPRLIALARGLGPSLMRISGTWANNTYLEAPGEQLSAPPEGFAQVLTRRQWKDVVVFSKAVDAPIVTSFSVSMGTRGQDGAWTTVQAQRLLDLTREAGGSLYAAEFFNEANVPSAASDMPKIYTAENYGSEFRTFRAWAKANVPEMKLLGIGGVGATALNIPANVLAHIDSEELMQANPNSLDVVSYHFYGAVSPRCAFLNIETASQEKALTPAWLDRTLAEVRYVSALRDKYEPGKPIWNSETAEAACGGSPWASTFIDSFRYLNQLGALAQNGVSVVMHNTLAASDYGLIDGDTLQPRPNYWAAVLWRRTMGNIVLASPKSPSPDLRLYAHCLAGRPGGVAVMALNTGNTTHRLNLGKKARGWIMKGKTVDTRHVLINGKAPVVNTDGALTSLVGISLNRKLDVPDQSIAFVAIPTANNPACR